MTTTRTVMTMPTLRIRAVAVTVAVATAVAVAVGEWAVMALMGLAVGGGSDGPGRWMESSTVSRFQR